MLLGFYWRGALLHGMELGGSGWDVILLLKRKFGKTQEIEDSWKRFMEQNICNPTFIRLLFSFWLFFEIICANYKRPSNFIGIYKTIKVIHFMVRSKSFLLLLTVNLLSLVDLNWMNHRYYLFRQTCIDPKVPFCRSLLRSFWAKWGFVFYRSLFIQLLCCQVCGVFIAQVVTILKKVPVSLILPIALLWYHTIHGNNEQPNCRSAEIEHFTSLFVSP